jgi:hypothetical protein
MYQTVTMETITIMHHQKEPFGETEGGNTDIKHLEFMRKLMRFREPVPKNDGERKRRLEHSWEQIQRRLANS